ncbi:MAG TPA: hypothetical protein VGK82_05685, partial [Pyrinomonadaceae bacterium]
RAAQTAREAALVSERDAARQRLQRELERKQEAYDAQLIALRGQFESERETLLREIEEDQQREGLVATQRVEMARLRHADVPTPVEENGARKARKGSER